MTTKFSGSTPVFVNAKQYEAINRRRAKKVIKEQRNQAMVRSVKIKKRYKYDSRSRHAKSRKRAQDGKFLKATDPQDSRTAGTRLRQSRPGH